MNEERKEVPKELAELKFYEGGLVSLGWAVDFLKKAKMKGLSINEIEEVILKKHGMMADLYMKAWRDYRAVQEVE